MKPLWQAEDSAEFYRERYRNRFHFSPREGWMNDINGLWYADGLYHLTYQAQPAYEDYMQWGHAVSPDLIHWEQRGLAIERGRHSVGAAWSGTAVIDTRNTAGFGAGIPVLFYTDIERGQCLAYSVDGGETFLEYEGNPVVTLDNPLGEEVVPFRTPGPLYICDQRDPKVFWHEETGRWVMMVFRNKKKVDGREINSMQFYTSPDLKHWTRREDFDHPRLFECPDVFALPLDGDPEEMRWVFIGGSSDYILGRFDGERLILESDPEERLCSGPDIYAGQSFVGLPGGRVVSMYWMDNWNGCTIPDGRWMHAATFPTELQLKTFADGVRLMRQPIAEIAQLYVDGGVTLRDRTTNAVTNPLDGLTAQCFDLTLVFSFKDSSAERVLVNIMDRAFAYDVKNGELSTLVTDTRDPSGALRYVLPCRKDGGPESLTLRFLVDVDSLEVFVNDGRYSYTEEYGFPYATKTLSVYADQPVNLPEIRFHEIVSTPI